MSMENNKMLHTTPKIEEDTIDLLELFFVLLNHWKMILVVMLLCAAMAGTYNYYFIEEMYQASSKVYISSTNSMINIQELQLSDALTVDYEEILCSRTVLKKVIQKLNLDMTYKDLRTLITISNPKDSHCLDISVTCQEPEMAVEITNCLVRIGLDQVYRIIGHEEPSIIDAAEADAVEVIKDSLLKYVLLGAMAGAVVVCGIIILFVLLDNTMQTEEDVEKYMELPVLAAVPLFELKKEEQQNRVHRKDKKYEQKKRKHRRSKNEF